jgi:hypothetical protein
MDRQITIRLPVRLFDDLRNVAERLHRSRSDVARIALRSYIENSGVLGAREDAPMEKVRDLIGSVESGVPDLGYAHREHVLSVIREGRKRWDES